MRETWAPSLVWEDLTCGDPHATSIPVAHAPQLLSLCSRIWELPLLSPRAATTEACKPQGLCFTAREATTVRSPCTATGEVKWSRSVMSDSLRPRGLQPTRFLHPWDFLGKNTGEGCHYLLQRSSRPRDWTQVSRIVGRRFTVWATREVQ